MQSAFLILLFTGATLASSKLNTVFEWKYIDFLWDSPAQKEQYIQNGDYDHKKIVPIDVDKAEDGRIFVTTIRNIGVPASLSVVTDQRGPSGPLLKPYPDWSWFKKGDCNGITSVYRVAIDECNKMYVLDNGMIGSKDHVCPAQVSIFDLKTDKLVNRIRIPDHVAQNWKGVGRLSTPALEVNGPNCDLVNIFMSDVHGRALVIYNNHRSFRLESRIFEPEPDHVNVTIAGESFKLEDSLMGLAVSPKRFYDDSSDVILRPFSSRAIYTADTRDLSRGVIKYKYSPDMLPSQASTLAFTSQGTLLFGLTRETAIGCWNRYTGMSKENMDIVAQDSDRLQFMSGLKVISARRTGGQEEVWTLSNRFQKIMTGTMNHNEINFRVMKASAQELLRSTKCQRPPYMYNL